MLRRLATAVVVLAAVVLVPAVPASGAPADFTFVGSGWGHGVGMSQYGAYGQALEGRSAAQILQHYYRGTAVVAHGDAADVRVSLLHDVPGGQARGEALEPGGGGVSILTDSGGRFDVGPGQVLDVGVSGGHVVVSSGGTALASGAVVTLSWSGPTLLNVAGPGELLDDPGHRYRHGWVDLGVVDGDLELVNQLPVPLYLRGVAEMPSSWAAEALAAQAIAARTYVLRKLTPQLQPECWCNVYDSVVDQVFAGWGKESEPGYGSRWVDAVDRTQGVTVVDGSGRLISANYFSSSGGRTQNNEDGFSGTPLPYLRSVDDRWSLSSRNPFAAWSRTKSQAEVAGAFELPDVVSIDLADRTEGGAVRTAVATASSGARKAISGRDFAFRLALPSRWLGTPVVRLDGDDRYETSVAIGRVAFPTAGTIVVVSGEDDHLVDGLVAGPLAAAHAAPLLLTAGGGLPDAVSREVNRRQPAMAFVVGGALAVSPAVEADLASRGIDVRRLAGLDRYETAAAVARELGGSRPDAVIASGEAGHLVDALVAGAPAGVLGQPVLLTPRDSLAAPTRQVLAELSVTRTVVAGGAAAVSDAVMAELPSPRRLAGDDRFSTAATIAADFAGALGPVRVILSGGADRNLVDALPGGAIAGVMLLTEPDLLSGAARDWLAARPDVGRVDVLGGAAAVSEATFDEVRALVYP